MREETPAEWDNSLRPTHYRKTAHGQLVVVNSTIQLFEIQVALDLR